MSKNNSTSNHNHIVIALATLLIVTAGMFFTVAKSKQQVLVVTEAAPQGQTLTGSDELDDLETELDYLGVDPVVEEVRVLDSVGQ